MLPFGQTGTDTSSSLAMAHHAGLLGRGVDVRVQATDPVAAKTALDSIVAEIIRLERTLLSAEDDTAFHTWLAGTSAQTDSDLVHLLGLTDHWNRATGGWFNPRIGVLVERWRQAERDGAPPDDDELASLARFARRPAMEIVGGVPVPTEDMDGFGVADLTRGFIVDRAVDSVVNDEGLTHPELLANGGHVLSALVSSGGRVTGRGSISNRVGIANPHRPFRDEPPLGMITLNNQAIATSTAHNDGFRVGRQWFSTLIDPHTGKPNEHTFSVTAVAPDLVAAEVIATAAAARPPEEAIQWLESLDDVEGLVIDRDAARLTTSGWQGTFN